MSASIEAQGSGESRIPNEVAGGDVRVPMDMLASSANTLFSWLGSFWTDVYEDDGLVRNLQAARAIRMCQSYLDALEAAKLVDRANAPVFHRERWFPIIVRKSHRNSGKSTVLKLGSEKDAVLGEQPSGVFPEGTVFKLGSSNYKFSDIVVYPLDRSVVKIASCIVDNIAKPSVVLKAGSEFSVIDGCLVLPSEMDPFGDNPRFFRYELNEPGTGEDEESVLWACDTFIDKDYVSGHLGYAMNLDASSTEQFKRIVNAAWNVVSEGAAPKLVENLVASLCGVPVVSSDNERVVAVLDTDDGWQVVTDREVYNLPYGAVPARSVEAGAVLNRFDMLDDSVHVYPYITDVDRISGYSEFFEGIEDDIPLIDLPPAYIRSGVNDGFSVGWDERPIYCRGFDSNGNPKLMFRMDGSDEDNDVFWSDVWSSYEKSRASMEKTFRDNLDDGHRSGAVPFVDGEQCGSITPIRFFLRQLIGANTLIITVRTDAIPETSPLYDPMFFATLRGCIPDHVRLYIIEHGGLESSYSVDDEDGGVEESVGSCVMESVLDEEWLEERDARRGFKVRDRVTSARLVPTCGDEYD